MTRSVDLPDHVYRAIEKRLPDSGFGTVDELVAHILRVVTDDAPLRLDAEEERMLEKRLRALGYL